MEYQIRSEETGLKFFTSIRTAIAETKKDSTIWKISFTNPRNNKSFRLVKDGDYWHQIPVHKLYADFYEEERLWTEEELINYFI